MVVIASALIRWISELWRAVVYSDLQVIPEYFMNMQCNG